MDQLNRTALLGLFTLVLLAANAAHAQTSTAAVNGTVRDSSGSIVPRANLALRNVETNIERIAATNETGAFVFLNVPPGNYTMEASHTGFAPRRFAPFRLAVNQTATFDVVLDVGTVAEQVTVQAVGVEVQASTSERGAVVARKQVTDLPLNGRNFTSLLALTPGVAPVNVSQGAFTGSVGGYVFPSVNGQRNRSNIFTLDGVINQQTFMSSSGVPPIIDSIEEFKVQSQNDLAEFGGVTGGIVNVVTRSGTNQLHGSVWEYAKNDAFNARSFFQPSVAPFKQHMYGVTTGGPVVLPKLYNGRNRTFFFVGWQGYRFRTPSNAYFRVPTDANYRGDFSDWPRQVYDPETTRPDPAAPGQFLRDPFAGNQIPVSRLDPRMVLYAKTLLPAPVVTGIPDRNAINTGLSKTSQEEYTMRFDQNVSARDQVWFRYSAKLLDPSGPGPIPALESIITHRSRNLGVNWVHTVSPSTVLQLQYGNIDVREDSVTGFRSLPANFIRDAGFADRFCCVFPGGIQLVPAQNVADYFSGGESVNPNHPSNTHSWKGSLTRTRGSHILKLGGEYNTMTFDSAIYNPNVSYVQVQTANPKNPGSTGSPLASFLLNYPNSAALRNRLNQMTVGGILGLFIQDQWKATSRLTLNYGLRYDRTFIPILGLDGTPGSYYGTMDYNTGHYLLNRVPPPCPVAKVAPCIPTPDGSLPANVVLDPRGRLLDDPVRNFQPRIGIAYRLTPRTAIRSGFGIFFDNWSGLTQASQNPGFAWPNVGEQAATNLNLPSAQNPTPHVLGLDPIQQGALPAATPFETRPFSIDPNLTNAYSLQWNLSVQHELRPGTVIDVAYVGNGNRRLDVGGLYGTAMKPGPGNPRDRQQYPYIAPTSWERSWGLSNYNALQASLNRRFSSGFAALISYTWSKSIDTGCSGWFGVEGCSIQNPNNFRADRSVSAFDIPHTFALSWLWELPAGRGKLLRIDNRVLDLLVGGWQLNGIANLRNGAPYTLSVTGDIPNVGVSSVRPNVAGDPSVSNPSPAAWFNTAAFAPPAQFTFGNLGRNRLRPDWYRNLDLTVFKQFPIRERLKLDLRAEAFNVTNTPVFGVPISSLSSPTFGKVLGLGNSPRQLQLGARIQF